jgi:hypothetical protein
MKLHIGIVITIAVVAIVIGYLAGKKAELAAIKKDPTLLNK